MEPIAFRQQLAALEEDGVIGDVKEYISYDKKGKAIRIGSSKVTNVVMLVKDIIVMHLSGNETRILSPGDKIEILGTPKYSTAFRIKFCTIKKGTIGAIEGFTFRDVRRFKSR